MSKITVDFYIKNECKLTRSKPERGKEESLLAISAGGFLTLIKKRAATYSPARRSTIGVDGLNFSVRNGKRWNPVAIATSVGLTWLRSKSNQLKECAHTTKVSGN